MIMTEKKEPSIEKKPVAKKATAAKKPAVKKVTAKAEPKKATAKKAAPKKPASKVKAAPAKTRSTATKKGSKLVIRLVGYDHTQVERSTIEIVNTAKKSGAQILGPIPLPTKKERCTILTSPHKYKDARDQFEIRTHKRLIVLVQPTEKTVDSLMKLDLAAGVDAKISVEETT